MREFKFRGKIIDHRTRFLKTLGYTVGDWIYGQNISVEPDDIDKDKTHVFICGIQVHPDTVGQYIGKSDFDEDIYDGDIILDLDGEYGVIDYNEEKLRHEISYEIDWYFVGDVSFHVVGNLWDNPELLIQDSEE